MTIPAIRPTLNVTLLNRVLTKILTDPEHWDQDSWVRFLPGLKIDEVLTPPEPCQTTCCLAGHALLMSGEYHLEIAGETGRPVFVNQHGMPTGVQRAAAEVLGLTEQEAHYLFITLTTRSPKRFVTQVCSYLGLPEPTVG